MQHYIRIVTSNLISKITDDQLHYTPAELISAGFPDFLVQRIRLELQRNLADSVTLPDSDWADMQADPVQDAWDNFLEAIHAEIRVPESYLQSVVENAVEDILELLAEPEKFTLDTLFRQEQQVSILEMHARRPWIVLNGHLADAVIRYMQRRKMQNIDRKKAANIIRQIDQHLASGYTPLKWAQALDVCFMLMGQRVPSSLIARYFADKGLTDISQRMEAADEELSRSRLIEYLSVPNLNWDAEEDYPDEETGPSIVAATPVVDETDDLESNDTLLTGYQNSDNDDSIFSEHDDSEDIPAQINHHDEIDEESVPLFQAAIPEDEHTIDDPFGLGETEEETESPASVLNQFMAEIVDVPDTESEPVTASDSLYARFSSEEEEKESDFQEEDDLLESFPPNDETDDEEFEPFQNHAHKKDDPADSDENLDDEPIPIWQRFISPDEDDERDSADYSMANTLGIERSDEEEEEKEIAPRIVTKNNHPQLSGKARKLLDQLDSNAPLFVDHLFDGNIHSFYEALNKLVTYDRWQDAGKYLTRDVFIPQGIDMYAGEAILFVDLVQQYFENQS